MSKLIAFYSRADENYFGGSYQYIKIGNTEKVANMIAEIVGGDKFKIEQKIPYSKEYGTCIEEAKKDLQANNRPEVINLPNNIDCYDEIYLGYPNYWSTMPMAVYTFLEKYDWSDKIIYPFCTHEGSGLSKTERDIEEACKGAIVKKGIAIVGSEVDGAKAEISKWIKEKQ